MPKISVTDEPKANWPRNGFEPLFEYASNFIHLNINLGSEKACHAYHDDWMRRYREHMDRWCAYDITIWSIRGRQALKLSFSATYFALASNEARSSNQMASAYYLAYYAMMHAMWAVLYLHPNEDVTKLTDITHSKIAKVFDASFSSSPNSIIKYKAKELAEDLRFLREYYSYRMPLNSPFDEEEFTKSHIHLGGFVKQCIQLANLHSQLIVKVADRLGLASAEVPEDKCEDFKQAFFRINGKEHSARGLRLLDPADEEAQRDALRKGCDLIPLALGFEHMLDNFMTYVSEDRLNEEIVQKTSGLVFNALF